MAIGNVFYDGADINKIVAFYTTDTASAWAGMTKLANPVGSFTVGVDIRQHKIVGSTITEMSAGEKTSHPLPVVDRSSPLNFDHPPVRAATTVALEAHSRSGNVLTRTGNGALPAQDGVTLVLADRLLVQNEGGGSDLENGIYIVTQLGDGSTPWILQRADDANSDFEVQSCLAVLVEEGTNWGGEEITLTTPNPITLNTTALAFNSIGGTMPKVNTTGVVAWSTMVSGDSNNRLQLTTDGQVGWGPGNAAVDTYMSRSGTGVVAFGEVDGTAPHSAYFYNSRSASGVNYERVIVATVAGSASQILTQATGTGVLRDLQLGRSTAYWTVRASSLQPNSDNALDAGESGARIRSIYWGTQALGPNGTAANPTFSFAADPDTGVWLRTTGALALGVGNGQHVELTGTPLLKLRNTISFGWTSGAPSTTLDVILARDAANNLGLRNGVNAQRFRWYNTFTDLSNYETGELTYNGTTPVIQSRQAGTGTARDLGIGSDGTIRWLVAATAGHLLSNSDNAYDAGGTSNRIRSVYVGTSIQIGTNPATSGGLRMANNSFIQYRNNANDGNIAAFNVSTDDQIYIGNTHGIVLRATDGGLRINNQSDGAGANTGTLTNSPVTGNPTFYLPISIAGVTKHIACW